MFKTYVCYAMSGRPARVTNATQNKIEWGRIRYGYHCGIAFSLIEILMREVAGGGGGG